ncbi:MAG: hypothetical protein IK081_11830 [Lachnospiraceae bacterium]|nr:hypothetical protein [Lachnospiraceae bacterium]
MKKGITIKSFLILLALVIFALPVSVRAEEYETFTTVIGSGPIRITVDLVWEVETVTGEYWNNTIRYNREKTTGIPTEPFEFDPSVAHYVKFKPNIRVYDPNGKKYVVYSESKGFTVYLTHEDSTVSSDRVFAFDIVTNHYKKSVGAPDSEYEPYSIGNAADHPFYERESYEWTYDGAGYCWQTGDHKVISGLALVDKEFGDHRKVEDYFTIVLNNSFCDYHIVKIPQGIHGSKENWPDENGNWIPRDDANCTEVKAVLENPYPGVEMSAIGICTLGAYEDSLMLSSYLWLPHGITIDESKTVYADTNREGYEIIPTFNHVELDPAHPRNNNNAPNDARDLYYLTVNHPAFGVDEPQICYLYADGGRNYEDRVIAIITYANRDQEYRFRGYLDKDYDGEPACVVMNSAITPYTAGMMAKWYYVDEDGQPTAEVTGTSMVRDESGDVYAYGPTEAGEYLFTVWVAEDMEVISVPFCIYESLMPDGQHDYVLMGKLDKEYDGEPVMFDPFKMLEIDKGKTSWGELEKNGTSRYVWRELVGKEWIDLKGEPSEVGEYQLVIQEIGPKGEWTDVQWFSFEISGALNAVPKIAKKTLTLYDVIAIDFKIEKTALESEYHDPYLVVTQNGSETVLTDYKVSQDEDYIVFSYRVAPQTMGDLVTAVPHALNAGEEDVTGEEFTYSVADYCYNMLAKDEYQTDKYAAFRKLLVDILLYGDAAQVYANYKTTELVSSGLTTEQRAMGTDVSESMTYQSVKEPLFATVESEIALASIEKAALYLEAAVNVRFKFSANNLSGLRVVITDDEACTHVIGEYAADASQIDKNGLYYVDVNCLNAGQMRKTIYATVMKGDEKVSNTYRYSIESYVQSKRTNEGTTLDKLLDAMMRYGDSAAAFAEPIK